MFNVCRTSVAHLNRVPVEYFTQRMVFLEFFVQYLEKLDEEFPKDHPLSKIFNRNTVKVSYGCTANVKHIIDGHNKSILTKQTESVPDEKTCNCNENVLECVLYNFHTQRKQKDVVCRGWVSNPRPSNY